MSAPRHHPASVGRSWVATQATDSGGILRPAAGIRRRAARTRARACRGCRRASACRGSPRARCRDPRRRPCSRGAGSPARYGRSDRRRDRRHRRPRPGWAPSGMTNSRVRPIAWSMRSMPAWRMLAASSARKPRQPSRAEASGSGGGRFQIWPCAENGSGGAPTLTPLRQFARARPAFRAVGRRADREIAIEADVEPGLLGALRRAGQLPVGEPLREEGERDLLRAARRLCARARRGRRAQRVRPAAPIFARALRWRSPGKWRSGAARRRLLRRSGRNRRTADRPAALAARARKAAKRASSAWRLIAQTAS